MFNHEHHQKILLILQSLNPFIFYDVGAALGGGTLITLLHNEYRWSKDIDFICPIGTGYKKLRDLVADNNFRPDFFFSNKDLLELPRDLKADQYGIRFLVIADGTPIKFEIVAEARIKLEPLEKHDWSEIYCLTFNDQCTEKLLANADRWADSSIESRDLIDLSILRLHSVFSQSAIDKAENAYSTLKPLRKAVKSFQENIDYRRKCFHALKIENTELILDGIDLLATDLGLDITDREFRPTNEL